MLSSPSLLPSLCWPLTSHEDKAIDVHGSIADQLSQIVGRLANIESALLSKNTSACKFAFNLSAPEFHCVVPRNDETNLQDVPKSGLCFSAVGVLAGEAGMRATEESFAAEYDTQSKRERHYENNEGARR